MEYNTNHTIKKKTQSHTQGTMGSAGATPAAFAPVLKNSYTLDYSGYSTVGVVTPGAGGQQEYGYQQPHAVRKLTETLPDGSPVRKKEIKYDRNGNQTEIKEKVGELEIVLRKNLWDEDNRLMGIDLKPDDPATRPIAVYNYDATGERTVRYNYNRSDVYSNAGEISSGALNNTMIYPSGLVMAKVLYYKDRKGRYDELQYTKHYYIGAERVAAKTGSVVKLGWYPQHMETGFTTMASNQNIKGLSDSEAAAVGNTPAGLLKKAGDYVTKVHTAFGAQAPSTATIPLLERGALIATAPHVANTNTNGRLIPYFFHPDHLGSSSYVTNRIGVVSQHTEYLPFGETLTDEHINSQSSPFKYNGKHLDEETGNYYYGARYYDPKLSIFISVDPLAEKTMSPYEYCYSNPIVLVDPDGMAPDGDYFSASGKYLRSDNINDKKIYVDGKEVPGGIKSLSAIQTSLTLGNMSTDHPTAPDRKGGQHEVRFDIDFESGTRFTIGGKVSISNGVATGEVTADDMMSQFGLFDFNNTSDIVGHLHPLETIISKDGNQSFTILATSPTAADYEEFKNHDVNIISGNLESKAVTKNSDGTINTRDNKKGGVYFNSNGRQTMILESKVINNILSNYNGNGELNKPKE